MKKIYSFVITMMLFLMLFSLSSCAPVRLQGSFSGSFSLTNCEASDDQYQYHFYGDGQGSEKNNTIGTTVSFTYTVMNNTLSVSTEQQSYSYDYSIEEKKNINITYQKNGKSETVLLTKN